MFKMNKVLPLLAIVVIAATLMAAVNFTQLDEFASWKREFGIKF